MFGLFTQKKVLICEMSADLDDRVVRVECCDHHFRQTICGTRPQYRSGRRATAVKVFTISDESKYLLIHRVPDIKGDVKQELRKLCQRFGPIDRLLLTHYDKCEEFTKVYLIQYKHFPHAVRAKKSLDDYNFLGSILHVCYAPELETIDDTRDKLQQRRRYVINQQLKKFETKSQSSVGQSVDHLLSDSSVESSNEVLVEKTTEDKAAAKRKFIEMSDKTSVESQASDSDSEPKKLKVTPKIRWRM